MTNTFRIINYKLFDEEYILITESEEHIIDLVPEDAEVVSATSYNGTLPDSFPLDQPFVILK